MRRGWLLVLLCVIGCAEGQKPNPLPSASASAKAAPPVLREIAQPRLEAPQ